MGTEITTNHDLLTALLSEEVLKPYAIKKTYTPSSEAIKVAQKSLDTLKKDLIVYDNLISEVEDKRNAQGGVLNEKLARGQTTFAIESDDKIEANKEGNGSKESNSFEGLYIERNFQHIRDYTEYAVKSLERLLKNSEKKGFSYLDAEKLSRTVSMLAEKVPRSISQKLYGGDEEAESYLASLSKKIDREIGDDAFVIARRLVGKYYGATALEELDGRFTYNAVLKKSKDLPLMEDLESIYDEKTEIRYLTPKGMVGYIKKFQDLNILRENVSALISKKKTLDVSMNDEDASLLRNALAKIDLSVFDSSITGVKEAESVFEKILNFSGKLRDRASTKEGRLKIKNAFADIAITSWATCYNYNLGKLDDDEEIKQARKIYQELFDANQVVKNLAISKALEINYEADDTDKTSSFPFDASNPYESLNLGRLITLYFESEITMNRLSALPTNYIIPSSETTRKKLEEVNRFKERARLTLENTQGEIAKIFLERDEEEIKETLFSAIENKSMKGTCQGWFKTDRLRQIISKSAEKILYSINDLDSETIEKVCNILDSIPEQSIKKNGRVMKTITDDGEQINVVTPPDISLMNTSAKFKFLANTEISSLTDAAIPKGFYAYYKDPNGTVLRELINSYKTDLLTGATSSDGASAIKAYNELKKFIDLIKANGGENSRCVKIMEEAEQQARTIFIEDYLRSVKSIKGALALKNSLSTDEDNNLSLALRDAGKKLGDKIVRKIAQDVLTRLGYKEIEELTSTESIKSPVAKYALSLISEAVVKATLEKTKIDMDYYETRNTERSIWKNMAGKKDGGLMLSLTKGTMPYMTDCAIREFLHESIPHSDIAEELGVLSLYPKERALFKSEEFKKYADLLKKEDVALRLNAERYTLNIDIDKAWNDTHKLTSLILRFDGTENQRREMDNLFTAILEDNPLNSERVLEAKKIVDNAKWIDFSERLMLHDLVSDTKYTTPYSIVNKGHVSEENILSREKRDFQEKKEKAIRSLEDTKAIESIPAEDRAAIMVGTNAIFNDIHAVTQVILEGKKHFDSPDKLIEFERELLECKNVIDKTLAKDLYKDAVADIKMIGQNDLKNIKQVSLDTVGQLPRGGIIETAKDPHSRMYFLPSGNAVNYRKAGFVKFEGEKKESLRSASLSQALNTTKLSKQNVIHPYQAEMKSMETYNEVFMKSEQNITWETLHKKFISKNIENIEYGLKDERLRQYEKPLRGKDEKESLLARKEFIRRTNALIERSRTKG